jgi:hypothetical protein
MSTSIRDFQVGLYQEHLEEASFLYVQRRALLVDEKVPWMDLLAFEDRLEAHLDALVVGGELALQVCKERCENGDEGELFASVSLFCRHLRSKLVASAIKPLTVDQPESIDAVCDALKQELPSSWTDFVDRALARGDPPLAEILARVAAYRRLPVTNALLGMSTVAGAPVKAIATTFGRLRSKQAREILEDWLLEASEETRSAVIFALLRIGIAPLVHDPHAFDWYTFSPATALGVGGSRAAGNGLVSSGRPLTGDQLLAIGLLGDLQAVPLLQGYLSDSSFSNSAALALHWITGAGMYADVFVEEQLSEDEMSDEEWNRWTKEAVPPRRPDGSAYGQTERQLSTDPMQWERWLAHHLPRFDRNQRYRSGYPITPGILLQNLLDPFSDRRLRTLAAEELAIRYGCDVPFETEMPVAQQLRALGQMKEWVDEHKWQFKPGCWYFAQALQHS